LIVCDEGLIVSMILTAIPELNYVTYEVRVILYDSNCLSQKLTMSKNCPNQKLAQPRTNQVKNCLNQKLLKSKIAPFKNWPSQKLTQSNTGFTKSDKSDRPWKRLTHTKNWTKINLFFESKTCQNKKKLSWSKTDRAKNWPGIELS